ALVPARATPGIQPFLIWLHDGSAWTDESQVAGVKRRRYGRDDGLLEDGRCRERGKETSAFVLELAELAQHNDVAARHAVDDVLAGLCKAMRIETAGRRVRPQVLIDL